jgi:hypothetical protein
MAEHEPQNLEMNLSMKDVRRRYGSGARDGDVRAADSQTDVVGRRFSKNVINPSFCSTKSWPKVLGATPTRDDESLENTDAVDDLLLADPTFLRRAIYGS